MTADHVFDSGTRKARKAHYCDSCGGKIAAGEMYDFIDQIWDGQAGTYKAHADCWRAADIVADAGPYYDAGEPVSNVSDFDADDWDTVQRADPELAARLRPIPH